MKKIKIIFILVLITSCNTVSDVGKVMRNEKLADTHVIISEHYVKVHRKGQFSRSNPILDEK